MWHKRPKTIAIDGNVPAQCGASDSPAEPSVSTDLLDDVIELRTLDISAGDIQES